MKEGINMELIDILIIIFFVTIGVYLIVNRICNSIDTRSMAIAVGRINNEETD